LIAAACALACITTLTAPGISDAAFSASGAGQLTPQALSLTPPAPPTVETTAALGCVLTAQVKISWDDPPPNTTYQVYTTAGKALTDKQTSKGSIQFSIGLLTNYKLRVAAGTWYKDSVPGTCKIVVSL
jgi:hypothetical protein